MKHNMSAERNARVKAAVEALHDKVHWCHDTDEQPYVYEPDVKWPCPTLAALTEAQEGDQ